MGLAVIRQSRGQPHVKLDRGAPKDHCDAAMAGLSVVLHDVVILVTRPSSWVGVADNGWTHRLPSSCAAQPKGKDPQSRGRASSLIPRFDLFELAAHCRLEFVELLRTQRGNAAFNITFNVWIRGKEFEASNTGRHIELQ